MADLNENNNLGCDGELHAVSHPGGAGRYSGLEIAGAERRIAGLVRAIEGEIIPRLMLAHSSNSNAQPRTTLAPIVRPTVDHVHALLRHVLGDGTPAAIDFVQSLTAAGVPLESVYLDLLSPAARQIGRMWDADLCSFTDVTVALWRLQEVMHELGMALHTAPRAAEPPHRVLLRQTPGDQHTFGLNMVGEFFRRAGWQVQDEASESGTEPAANVRSRWFDVVGLSLSAERHLDSMATTIRAIRRGSRNRGIGVMVGGPVFVEHPDWVARVGADTTASDGRQAVLQAHTMIGLLARCG
ncbi:MAG: cobalamin B12-binding domain-containing protein [Proteobacteria bacterium]|nr:cobalamin B12-binding domain-containing protein [Burkholderiales bacterium]